VHTNYSQRLIKDNHFGQPGIWGGGGGINPLNTELNLICNLLALLGANRILHISRIRVKIYLKEEGCENMVEIYQDMVH
jgi:hypothetical protein